MMAMGALVTFTLMYARVFGRWIVSSASHGLRSYGTMFGDHCPFVVTPAQLHNLNSDSTLQQRDLVVLDASWHMPNSPRKANQEYNARHIPSSRFLDIDRVASPHPLNLAHMMPDPNTFAKACCKDIAIRPDHDVPVSDLLPSGTRYRPLDACCHVRFYWPKSI